MKGNERLGRMRPSGMEEKSLNKPSMIDNSVNKPSMVDRPSDKKKK